VYLEEVLSVLGELKATDLTKIDFEEKELIRKAIIELSVEENLRKIFISQLEDIL
jgi:hypothetical protein